jgi:hypothetical protein
VRRAVGSQSSVEGGVGSGPGGVGGGGGVGTTGSGSGTGGTGSGIGGRLGSGVGGGTGPPGPGGVGNGGGVGTGSGTGGGVGTGRGVGGGPGMGWLAIAIMTRGTPATGVPRPGADETRRRPRHPAEPLRYLPRVHVTEGAGSGVEMGSVARCRAIVGGEPVAVARAYGLPGTAHVVGADSGVPIMLRAILELRGHRFRTSERACLAEIGSPTETDSGPGARELCDFP